MSNLRPVFTAALGREVYLRPNTSDEQVWADTFSGLYHVPPPFVTAPRSVLDLGANIGLTAAHYKRLWPDAEVVAVEMDADSAALIERNAPGVHVRRHAVSSHGGWGSYSTAPRAEARQFLLGEMPKGSEHAMSYTLGQIILRSFEQTTSWKNPVDFVKMDIEGMEWPLFKAPTWAPLVCHLLVELHPHGDQPDDSAWLLDHAIAALERIGFDTKHHTPHPRAVWAVRR